MVQEVRASERSMCPRAVSENPAPAKGVPFVPLRITIVDDNAADRYLLKEALYETGIPYVLSEMGDACEALSLFRRGFPVGHGPEIVVLDINIPKCDGFEILRAIRSNTSLTDVIVIMCSSSRSEADILAAYRLGANVYVDKGRDLDEIFRMMGGLVRFCCMALRKVAAGGRWSPEWVNAA